MPPLTPYPPAPLTIDPFDNPVEPTPIDPFENPVEPTPDELKLLEDLRNPDLPDPPDDEGEAKYPQDIILTADDIKRQLRKKIEEIKQDMDANPVQGFARYMYWKKGQISGNIIDRQTVNKQIKQWLRDRDPRMKMLEMYEQQLNDDVYIAKIVSMQFLPPPTSPPPLASPPPSVAPPPLSLAAPPQSPDDIKNEVLNKMEELSNEIAEIVQPQLNAFIEGRPGGPKRKENMDLTPEQFKAKRLDWIKQHRQQIKDDIAAYKNKLENSRDVKDKIKLYNLLNDSLLKDDNEKLRVLKLVDDRPVIATTVQAKLKEEINNIEEDIQLNPLPETIAFVKLLRQRRLQDPEMDNATANNEYRDFLLKNDPRKKQQELLRRRINDKRFLDEATAKQIASLASTPSIVNDDAILDILKASNISPPEEEKEEVKGPEPPPKVVIKPSKKLVTANDIREEIKAKMETLKKEINTGLKLKLDEYNIFLKQQRELNKQDIANGVPPEKARGITKEQATKSYKNYDKSLKESDEFKDKIKQYRLLEASLLDDDSVKGIAAKQNIQNLADARNFEITKKALSKKGQKYLEKKLNIVKGELEEKENKYLVDDPDNPGKKMLNPNFELGVELIDGELFENIPNSSLNETYQKAQDNEKEDPTFKSSLLINAFKDEETLKNYLIKYNTGIKFIEKKDRYMIDSFINNIFELKRNAPIPIIFDVLSDELSDRPDVASTNLLYIIDKYINNEPDANTRKNMLENIISYSIKNMLDKYYIYDKKNNLLEYADYINNFIEGVYKNRDQGQNNQEWDRLRESIKIMPKIAEIRERLDKIDTKRISLKDKLDVAELWNKLYKKHKGFSRIWSYMGLNKSSFYGNNRGTALWNEIFDSNPAFSKKHNLFAIGDLKEALARREKMKKEGGNIIKLSTIKEDFIKDNINFFQSKGETLTPDEALQLFTDIINSIRQKKPISPPTAGTKISTLSSIKKGSGISKRKILKYLKGKSSISKPTIKGLDTEIFNILNS